MSLQLAAFSFWRASHGARLARAIGDGIAYVSACRQILVIHQHARTPSLRRACHSTLRSLGHQPPDAANGTIPPTAA